MDRFPVGVLLATALTLPVIVFLTFRPRNRLGRIAAVIVAVAAGWAFNIAAVVAVEAIRPGALGGDTNPVEVATSFGWVCPLLTALATWFVWHLITRRIGPARH